MPSIQELLQKRIESSQNVETFKEQMKTDKKEYRDKWLHAISCFQDKINRDRFKENKSAVRYMQIYDKLKHIKEIDDLRWFYKECLRYSKTIDKKILKRNTFSRCFWGSLKVR